MTNRTRGSWLVYVLGALCAGAIVTAVLVVGPASGSQAKITRTATAAQGVVQSTVSGSGNLQPITQLNLGFKTSGTVTHIYVTQGEQVAQGQLLATLDPQSAEVALEQAKAALQSAEANLVKVQETDGETSAGSSGGGATASSASRGEAASEPTAATARLAAYPGNPTTTATTPAATAPTSTTPAGTTPTSTTPAGTTPTATAPTSTTPSKTPATTTPATSPPSKTRTTTSPTTTGSHEREGKEASSSSSSSKPTVSAATREANLASARAAVRSDKLTVQSAEQAVQDTKLFAPDDGTIVSLSGQVGEVVSGSGTTKASSSSSASSGSGSSATAGTGAAGSGRSAAGGSTAAAGASSSSGSSTSSSSAFAILSNLTSMQLVVPLSESEIGHVKVGQIATITVEALEGRKLAAHVFEVATLSTSNSGVVSYDVTFQLDQMEAGLKPGMSATAEVVVKQEEGVNVPTSAITAGSVTVIQNGKQVRRRVTTGLAGNSSTVILSGLKAGEKVALPVATTTTSSSSARGATGRGGLGGGALGGGLGGGGFGGGGAAFFRGGG